MKESAVRDPDADALRAATEGRYVVLDVLGRGGMGVVYLARDLALERSVAIKVLPAWSDTPVRRERFVREARTAAGLSHPNIVPIHAVEERDGLLFFVMAYVEGDTLGARVERDGPLSVPEATRVLQEVAWALGHAHQRGVVHRDIKPDNIILERGSGRALVMDFGIARLVEGDNRTTGAELIGTPNYMSPEQLSGTGLDGRSDLYALGVTGFFALTGSLPFEAPTFPSLLAKVLTEPAAPVGTLRPDLPRDLAAAMDRCLAKEPADRFASAEALADALGTARERAPELPAVLVDFRREIERLGVDTGGFAALVLVVATAPRHDTFFDIDSVFSLGVITLVVGFEAMLIANLWRAARAVVRAGFGPEDLKRVFGGPIAASGGRGSPIGLPTLLVFGACGLATIAYWYAGGRSWLHNLAAGRAGAMLFDALGCIAPMLLGRSLAARLLPGTAAAASLWRRVWSGAASRFLLRLAGRGVVRRFGTGARTARPTELVLGGAASEIFKALPSADRARLGDVPKVIALLTADAEALRNRQGHLDVALSEAGVRAQGGAGGIAATAGSAGALHERRAAAIADLERVRDELASRLSSVLAALENIRIDLLRLRAGVGSPGELTADLEAARAIGAEVDALLVGRAEVEALTRRG